MAETNSDGDIEEVEMNEIEVNEGALPEIREARIKSSTFEDSHKYQRQVMSVMYLVIYMYINHINSHLHIHSYCNAEYDWTNDTSKQWLN